jgi:leucyl aminopeptidase
MEFSVKSGQGEKQKTHLLIVPIYEPRRLSPTVEKINVASNNFISNLVRKGDLDGKYGQMLLFQNIEGIPAERLLLVGCGREGEMQESQFRDLIFKMIATINDTNSLEAIFCINELHVKNKDNSWKIRQIIQWLHTAFYRFDDFKSKKEPIRKILRRVIFIVPTKRDQTVAERAVNEGVAIAQGIELTKNLANVPPNVCTPSYLADKAKKFAKGHAKVSVAVLEEKDMAALGMGSLLSVTQGSNFPAKLITLEYRGARKDVKPIVFVGKGITFDTGGNSIKIPPYMIGMKYDMCGAATVFGVLEAAIQLELPLNIIGVIPSCENMPGPNATRPEDIVTSMSGLTIEILNTDAEGRLILADALTYCERFHPEAVIDIATLTGACQLALGPYASGLMSNNDQLAHDLSQAGFDSTDKVWQLPLWDEYHDALKSDFADIANVPVADIGARTIVAGCFLSKFAQKFPWAHLDVANTATLHGSKRGATGRPVALLVQYLLNRCKAS